MKWSKYISNRQIPKHEKEFVIKMLDLIEQDGVRYKLSNLIIWYIDKAEYNKRFYIVLTIITLFANVSIPIINMIGSNASSADEIIPILTSCIAAIASISLGIISLCHFKENWMRYRKSAEDIKKIVSDYIIALENCKQDYTEVSKKYSVQVKQNGQEDQYEVNLFPKGKCVYCNKNNKECKILEQLCQKVNQVITNEHNAWYQTNKQDNQNIGEK